MTPPLCSRKTLKQVNDFFTRLEAPCKKLWIKPNGKGKFTAVINGAPGRAIGTQAQGPSFDLGSGLPVISLWSVMCQGIDESRNVLE